MTEWVGGMRWVEVSPTLCRAAVTRVLQGYSILLSAADSQTQPSPSLRDVIGDENNLERRQKRTAEENTALENTVYEQEFNLSKLEKWQQEMGNVCSQLST